MKFNTDNITLQPFNNAAHLHNHLKYLFRTDERQKWTNKYSYMNLVIMDNMVYSAGRDIEERKKAQNMARKIIREHNANYDRLYMCRIECPDSAVYFFDEQLFDEAMYIIRELGKELKRDGLKILFAVTHNDQTDVYLHFHLLICEEQ